ncbi:MAG: alanine racemase [Phycisphaerae bacterium]
MESYLKAEVSSSAVAHNLELLRGMTAPGVKLCAVVKADCYGHGLEVLLNPIAAHADCLAVATPQEAVQLRDLGYERPVLAFFSPCAYAAGRELAAALEELVARRITMTLTSEADLAPVAQAAARVGATAEAHLKIDTGMGRSGAPADSAAALIERIRATPGVKLTGAYTHLASADEADKSSAIGQLSRFVTAVGAGGGRRTETSKGLTLHAANSAAIIDLPQAHLDMVRAGIAMYGYQPSGQMRNRPPLRPLLRLTGPLMQVKTLPAGSACGYGLTRTFDRDTRVGLVPVGYADGYFRCLSNKAAMRVGGREAPVLGRVSMDQTIIDLTAVPLAKVGDEVEILSDDPSAPNSVEGLAALAGTISYEITCRLGRRIRRVLID